METHRLRMYRDSTETCTPTLATGRMFIWTGRLVVGVVTTYWRTVAVTQIRPLLSTLCMDGLRFPAPRTGHLSKQI